MNENIEKVKNWLCNNFFDITHDSDYGDYTTLETSFSTFEEMMADFNKKKWRCKDYDGN